MASVFPTNTEKKVSNENLFAYEEIKTSVKLYILFTARDKIIVMHHR